ncbi:hypothetical protein HOY80DRAFT_1078262 [Tuber brumale]|nr:hypothetical protein HOY80DRAFT_1078262 [Tuber brumale]
MSLVQSALPNPSMLTTTADHTTNLQLTEYDMERDLDMTVWEEKLDEIDKPLINWEEDEKDEDVDFVDLYGLADRDGRGSEDSDGFYGEEEGDMEEKEGDMEEEEKGEEAEEEEGEEEKALLWTFIKSKDEDIDMMEKRDSDENRFRASMQEIGEHLLGQAMTPKDFFSCLEDQQDSIVHIVTKRKWFLAGNARLIVDLEATARKDAAEQGINLEEMDEIDCEMDWLVLLNMANMRFTKRVKQEPRE